MNRLVILEDDLNFSRTLFNYIISRNKEIQLWSLSINGEEILEKIDELNSDDIILLDLGLPKVNGIDIIEKIKEKQKHMPYIIVMSGDSRMLEDLGKYIDDIYCVIHKPFAFEKIVHIIQQILTQSKQEQLEVKVKRELEKFKFNTATVGYLYIVDAIILALQDEMLLKDMKNGLYRKIAIKHNLATIINIKWSVEKCIQAMTRYTSSSVINQYFHLEKNESLTPKLCIMTIVSNLKEYKEEKESALV